MCISDENISSCGPTGSIVSPAEKYFQFALDPYIDRVYVRQISVGLLSVA